MDEKNLPAARVQQLVARLTDEAHRRVRDRATVEQRWLEDLYQYHGVYDAAISKQLVDDKRSQVFANMTRVKTDAITARMQDLLFPTDDRNWDIQPTPVPELTKGAEEALDVADDALDMEREARTRLSRAAESDDADEIDAAALEGGEAHVLAEEAQSAADRLQEQFQEAARRCDLMRDEIDDQMADCRYSAAGRRVIEDGFKLGTGVVKGPVLGERTRRRYQQGEDGWTLTAETSKDPSAHWVDPWGFFPDPTCQNPADGDGVFERHLWNAKKMRRFARRPDVDTDALAAVLTAGPDQGEMPNYLVDLRNIGLEKGGESRDRFVVWEYTGTIDAEDLRAVAEDTGDAVLAGEAGDDPLAEINVRMWFCQGKLLSFAPHPLDSGETIYSVFCPAPAEASPFGYSWPYLLRDPQAMLNGASRQLMDNSALSTGPQIIVNREVVEPADGSWHLAPGKIWFRKDTEMPLNVPAFEAVAIPGLQGEIAGVIDYALRLFDEVSALPAVAQGEAGALPRQTATGMSLLMNAANVVFRRIVKTFDDDVTVPLVRRFYHWNMQFSERDEIKGDFEVDARGSSVLLVREMVANNLMIVAQTFGESPKYGPMLKDRGLFEEIFKAHSIPSEVVLKTQREIAQEDRDAQENPPPEVAAQMQVAEEAKRANDLKEAEINGKIEIANMETDSRRYVIDRQFEMKMQELAERGNQNLDRIDAQGRDKSEAAATKAASDERRLAAEIAMRNRTGVSSGGAI